MDPKKLFKELDACRKADKKYSFADRNDGMVEARLKREKDTYILVGCIKFLIIYK